MPNYPKRQRCIFGEAKSDISKGASAVVRRDIPRTKTSVQVDKIGIVRPSFNSSNVPEIWISSRMSPMSQRMTLPQMSDFELTHPRTMAYCCNQLWFKSPTYQHFDIPHGESLEDEPILR